MSANEPQPLRWTMKALLIIDMQVGVFSNETPRFNTRGVTQRINTLSAHFRNQGDKVIFIQHDGIKEDYLFHGTPDWKILSTIDQGKDDLYIDKTVNDAFYETDLESNLKSQGINELFITGCATDFCVNATVHSALVRDFNITIAQDCHTTADRPDFKAEQLIRFHNWLWANLTPTRGAIQVKSLRDIVG